MSLLMKLGVSMMFATLGLCAAASQAAAQTLTTLVSFNGTDGGNAIAGLILATDGNFYGTASTGGASGGGTVFRMSPSGALTTLHNFCSQVPCSDGSDPVGGLIQATDGNLYGTTATGGTTRMGTVFQITLDGTLTTLATFGGSVSGQGPSAALVQGSDGNFYGTTVRGGNDTCFLRAGYRVSCGTVFKMTPAGTVTTLALLTQATGFWPVAPLIQASDGSFYGTASKGGGTAEPGDGTIFKITSSGTLTVVYRFSGTDGEKPLGALVLGSDGNFYGTTSFGGGDPGFGGTVFKLTPGGTLTTLYSFGSGAGFGPSAALIQATDGNFYGTTGGNGTAVSGTAFKITPGGTLTTLASFSGTNGETPVVPLVEGPSGLLYGTTEYGVNSACYGGCGTVFSLSAGLH